MASSGNYQRKTIAQIRGLARQLRQFAGFKDQRAPNLLALLEAVKSFLPKLRILVVEDSYFPPHIHARAYPQLWLIKVRVSFIEGLKRNDPRTRWTFVHELAHILFRHPKTANRSLNPVSPNSLAFQLEQEANLFAAELLMPFELIPNSTTLTRLAEMFLVSSDAARRRVREHVAHDRYQNYRDNSLRFARSRDRLQELLAHSPAIERAFFSALRQFNGRSASPSEALELRNSVTLVISCAALLLSAYESLREHDVVEAQHLAAAVAAAIIKVQPIPSSDSNLLINEHCALRSAAELMGLDCRHIHRQFLKRVCRTEVKFADGGSLESHLKAIHLLRDSGVRINLAYLPTFEEQDPPIRLTRSEVSSLDGLVRLFKLLKGAVATRPRARAG